jgi:hypothetical protein
MMIAIADFNQYVVTPFQIYPGVVVPPGTYDEDSLGIQLSTGTHRKVSVNARYVNYPYGRFYGGSRLQRYVELTWRPSARYRVLLSRETNDIDLPQGAFLTRLVRAGFDIAFSPTLSWVNLIQYDNVSEVAGINTRLLWIPKAGREIYFVINHNIEDLDRDNQFRSSTVDATAKVNYTVRF